MTHPIYTLSLYLSSMISLCCYISRYSSDQVKKVREAFRSVIQVISRHVSKIVILCCLLSFAQNIHACPSVFDKTALNTEGTRAPAISKENGSGTSTNLGFTRIADRRNSRAIVPGGESAAVALDFRYYSPYSSAGSKTNLKSKGMASLMAKIRSYGFAKGDYVIGHLINQQFGGNVVGPNNFHAITRETNNDMASQGEGITKALIENIGTNYYKNGTFETNWAAKSSDDTLFYKPGILYETKVRDIRTVKEFETAQSYDIIEDTRLKDYALKRMQAVLETKSKYIMHEFRKLPNGKYEPTEKWFDMPKKVFDDNKQSLMPNTPAAGLNTSGRTKTKVNDNGLSLTWLYLNSDRDDHVSKFGGQIWTALGL